MKTFVSNVSGKEFPESEKMHAKAIRKAIFDLIEKEHPSFNHNSFLSISELNQYRQKYISEYLLDEVGELGELEKDVLETIQNQEAISSKIILDEASAKFTHGQRLADTIASFGGSWKFIIIFGAFILVWMCINIIFLASCLAALQAPVIMMSQNRQEEKDRERAKQDYMINLKSELEIRMLHEKLDHLIIHQQQELLNIQQVQVEMMEDIMKRLK